MRAARASALIVLFAAFGCGDAPTQSASASDGTARVGRLGDIVQTVTLTPASPRSGETVSIRSAIVNRGSAPVPLTSRICGLDFEGSLDLAWPLEIGKCGGYSMHDALVPGDSVVTYDLMQVTAPAGRHVVRIRHALTPETWVELDVHVRGAAGN